MYFARACGMQVAHDWFSVMDNLLFLAYSLPNQGVTYEMATHSPFSVTNHNQYFVFMTATAENPVL